MKFLYTYPTLSNIDIDILIHVIDFVKMQIRTLAKTSIRIRPLDLPGHEPPLQGGLGVRAEDPVPYIDKDPDPGLDLETNSGSARGHWCKLTSLL